MHFIDHPEARQMGVIIADSGVRYQQLPNASDRVYAILFELWLSSLYAHGPHPRL